MENKAKLSPTKFELELGLSWVTTLYARVINLILGSMLGLSFDGKILPEFNLFRSLQGVYQVSSTISGSGQKVCGGGVETTFSVKLWMLAEELKKTPNRYLKKRSRRENLLSNIVS